MTAILKLVQVHPIHWKARDHEGIGFYQEEYEGSAGYLRNGWMWSKWHSNSGQWTWSWQRLAVVGNLAAPL